MGIENRTFAGRNEDKFPFLERDKQIKHSRARSCGVSVCFLQQSPSSSFLLAIERHFSLSLSLSLFSIYHSILFPVTVISIMALTTKRADFEALFPSLVEDLLSDATKYGLPENALQWFKSVILPPAVISFLFLCLFPSFFLCIYSLLPFIGTQCQRTRRQTQSRTLRSRHWPRSFEKAIDR